MSNLIVSRFGGMAAANSDEIKKAADVIRADPARRYIVVSAPGSTCNSVGMTDMLYICHSRVKNRENYSEIFYNISSCFEEIVKGLGINFDIDSEIATLKRDLEIGRDLDYIGSRGEYITAKIFAEFLGWNFVDASEIIFFDGNGVPDQNKTFSVAGETLKNFEHAVIPSFYGSMPGNRIKTFPRGDCDTAGALIACAVKADLFEKWSESTKLFSADPKVIPDSKLIQHVTYMEAVELNYVGINIINDDVIYMLNEAGIPMKIVNTRDGGSHEMLISPKLPENISRSDVVCIAGHKNFNTLHIQKHGLNKLDNFGEKLFSIFAKYHVPCQNCLSGIHKMTVVIKNPRFDLKRSEIIAEIQKTIQPYSIEVKRNLSLIAVVGEGMGTKKGLFAKIFTALANAQIKVRMIDEGSDDLNIIIGVFDEDYENAIKALYNDLVS